MSQEECARLREVVPYVKVITDGSYYVEKDTKLVFRMWKQLGSVKGDKVSFQKGRDKCFETGSSSHLL
jgi:hypothetical protein